MTIHHHALTIRPFLHIDTGEVIAISHSTTFGVLLGLSMLVLAWILRVNRTIPNQTMHEVGFRAMRLRLYLAMAGILWLLCVPSGLGLYIVFLVTPRLRGAAELPLWIAMLVVGIVIPVLIIRSANLARGLSEMK